MPRDIGSHLTERVRRYREALGLRQEDIAERTAQLGYPMNRVTLAKIEKGGTRAANASLVDVLVLAAALDVPPPLLFVPLGEDEDLAITPKLVAHPHIVLEWVAGKDDLRSAIPWGSHSRQWGRNSQPLRLLEGLREREQAVRRAQARMEAVASDDNSRGFDQALMALHTWREAMRVSDGDELLGLAMVELPDEWQSRLEELEGLS